METLIEKTQPKASVKLLFEEFVCLTGVKEYGISWENITAGTINPPPQGARFDISFEGKLKGENINGLVKGVDYLEVRADGKLMLNIYATILTDDGETIALREDGIMTPDVNGVAKLYLNMKFSTASPKYEWLCRKQVWGVGEVNRAEGTVTVYGYVNNF